MPQQEPDNRPPPLGARPPLSHTLENAQKDLQKELTTPGTEHYDPNVVSVQSNGTELEITLKANTPQTSIGKISRMANQWGVPFDFKV